MTRSQRLDDLRRRLEDAWRRFLALPPRLKALAIGGTASLAALAVVLTALALSGGDGGREPGPAAFEPSATADTAARPTPTARVSPPPAPTPTPVPKPAANAYALSHVFQNVSLPRMVGFAPVPGAPNEAAVITQETGEVWKVYLGGAAPVKMGDLTPLMAASLANEEGLLGVAFSPAFRTDHIIYLYYTADAGCSPGFGRCSVITRFTVSGNAIDMASAVEIMRVDQPYGNHNGGHLAFGPDGYLYIGLGDGGSAGDPQGNGQNINTLLGSILRISPSGGGYTVPPSNPFVGKAGADEIFAYGFRNPWRFSFDRFTGQLWAGDVGQNAWEEVDYVVSGGNYGWNCREGFEVYNASSCPAGGLRPPRAAYDHSGGSCSVTGGYVYRGSALPEMRGWFVYGDYCSGRIWAVNTVGSDPPVLLADTNVSIASFGELPSGELVVLTFQNAIYRLVRA